MTQQAWFPSPNPGGQNRALIRRAVANWIIAQRIQGVDHVYAAVPTVWQFDAYPQTGTGYGTLVAPWIPDDSEDRTAYTGSRDPGGKTVHYPVELRIRHWSYTVDDAQDSEASQDDIDRVIDALKDCLRGRGRDLGRPDVILAAGERPREGGITSHQEEPVTDQAGSVLRVATVSFNVSQYLTTFYPRDVSNA